MTKWIYSDDFAGWEVTNMMSCTNFIRSLNINRTLFDFLNQLFSVH